MPGYLTAGPTPSGPASLGMKWHDLLFAHWPMPVEALRSLLPSTNPALELDTFQGEAWIGVVPFRMSGIRLRGCPPIPGTAAFPELNVRTYVRANGRTGVWFFSLDAASWLAVRAARISFHLPYFDAVMACERDEGWIRYASRRQHRRDGIAELTVRYCPTGPVFQGEAGSLEDWLTARYRLFAADRRGKLWRGEIQHEPWPLQRAQAEFTTLDMVRWLGLELPVTTPHLLYSRCLAVQAWRLLDA
jgi:uncharacterized protein YqjF (DUF2071 family)